MTKPHLTKGSIIDDLNLPPEEAKNLKFRAALMRSIEHYIDQHNLKQKEAADLLGITQPRVSDLMRGKINLFSIDQLIKMHERIHINVTLIIDDRLVA